MDLQNMLSVRFFRNEVLKDFEISNLDPEFLSLLRENEAYYKSFHELFIQLRGTTAERIRLINKVIEYMRDQM